MTLPMTGMTKACAAAGADAFQAARPAMDKALFRWLRGPLNAGPMRYIRENPRRLVGRHIRPGMTVLDIGCGAGFYTLPMARLVSPGGKVIAVDFQPMMIARLMRRVERAGLVGRVVPRLSEPACLELSLFSKVFDFALACGILGEVPDRDRFFSELRDAMVDRGRLCIAEPRGSRAAVDLEMILVAAAKNGFSIVERPLAGGPEECAALLELRPQERS